MPSTSSAITVTGLGKCYRVWSQPKPTSLKDRFALSTRRLVRPDPRREPLRKEIWALRDVSFDVPTGEVVGVIGANGAGKSTLLAILARITEPSEGTAVISGRVSSLLEVGTGFHPELTGRDNVFLNGAVLGMSRAQIARRFDEIVDFSGVEEFIDIPVKRYSSGMYVRLAFAVAAHLEPDVLLLDEVLAVGDRVFQDKCLRRISEMTQSGRTVLFVSHDVAAVARLCHRVLVVARGNLVFDGDTATATARYMRTSTEGGGEVARPGTGEVRVTRVLVRGPETEGVVVAEGPMTLEIELEAGVSQACDGLVVSVGVDSPGIGRWTILSTETAASDPLAHVTLDPGATLICSVDELPLKPGEYTVGVTVRRRGVLLDQLDDATDFVIAPSDFLGTGIVATATHPAPVLARHRWAVESAPTSRALRRTAGDQP